LFYWDKVDNYDHPANGSYDSLFCLG